MLYKYKRLLENVINNKVICHITGPSGAGKTTILSMLKSKYSQFEYMDLDDLEKMATESINYIGIKRYQYTDDMYKKLHLEKQRIFNKLLNKSNKQWILAGHHTEYPRIYHSADSKVHIINGDGKNYWLDIPTDNRFFLEISPELSTQRFKSRSEKNGKSVSNDDMKLLKINAINVIKLFKKLGYKEMSDNDIMNWFDDNVV